MNNKVTIIKGASIALGVSALLLGISIFQALLDPQPVNYLSGNSRFFMALSLLAGGFYAGYNTRKKGWLAGGSVGFIYSLIGFIGSLVLIPRVFSLLGLIDILVPGTILAGVAGVCGVNIVRAQRKEAKTAEIQIKKQVKY